MSDPVRRYFEDEALRRYPSMVDVEDGHAFVQGAIFAFDQFNAGHQSAVLAQLPGNPPAYPLAYAGAGHVHNPGMSMRDTFAIAAMQGMLACGAPYTAPDLAIMSWRMADLMMVERAKELNANGRSADG